MNITLIGNGSLAHALDAYLRSYSYVLSVRMLGREDWNQSKTIDTDICIVTVKAHDLKSCLLQLNTHGIVIVACNGIIDSIIREFETAMDLRLAQTSFAAYRSPNNPSLFCVTSQNPYFRFGRCDREGPSCLEQNFLKIFDDGVFEWNNDPLAGMWHKWVMNVSINLCSIALAVHRNEDLLHALSDVRRFLDQAYVYYNDHVAENKRKSKDEMWRDVQSVIHSTAKNVNSTLDDIRNYRSGEIEYLLNGFKDLRDLMNSYPTNLYRQN